MIPYRTLAVALIAAVTACSKASEHAPPPTRQAPERSGRAVVVRDTTYDATLDAHGVAEPFARATVSTKLMGTVVAVFVREGDRVSVGTPLVQIDARDIDAKRTQIQAGIASAEAMRREASLMATRMRALYADSAAPKAQLDAAESALSRAEAGVAAAHAGEAELNATAGYAMVRAPFSGVVTQRFVDPGAFAAPGAPMITIQDDSRLRLTATVDPGAVAALKRGATLSAMLEGRPVTAKIEGVVPSPMGSLYTINAIVENKTRDLPLGGSVVVSVRTGTQRGILVPAQALRSAGDLVGVTLAHHEVSTRWVKTGRTVGPSIEVLSGLAAGDTILIPNQVAGRP